MSIVSEIKCARCDRKYSGVRSRCPYCGARRIGRGKYSEESDNSKGKMLISVLIMGVLVVAAGVLLFTTPVEAEGGGPPVIVSPEPTSGPEDDIESMEGTNRPSPTPTPSPELETPTPTPAPEVRSVLITHNNRRMEDFTARVGEVVPLGVRVEPVGVEEEIIWLSSDRSVFEVVETNAEGSAVRVTGIGPGTATLTVSVGGVEATCIVRVRR